MILDLPRRWMGYSPLQVAKALAEIDREHREKVAALRLEVAQAREAASAVEQAVSAFSGRMANLEPQVQALLLALAQAEERERHAIEQVARQSPAMADEQTQGILTEIAEKEQVLSHLWGLQGALAEALQQTVERHLAALVEATRFVGLGVGGRP